MEYVNLVSIPAEPLLRKVMSVSDPWETVFSPVTRDRKNTLRRCK